MFGNYLNKRLVGSVLLAKVTVVREITLHSNESSSPTISVLTGPAATYFNG